MILNLTGLLVDILTPTIEWLNVKTINFPSPFWYPFSEQYSFQAINVDALYYWGGHSFRAGDNLGIFYQATVVLGSGFLPKMGLSQSGTRRSKFGGQSRLELGSCRRAHWKPMKPFNFVCCLVEIVA